MNLAPFERLESEVRGYVRAFPTVFETASGARMTDEEGRTYLDFFAGAGTLNYGHNPPQLKQALLDYLGGDGIVHGLDMATAAKRRFMETFHELILEPRGLDYKMQFTGPTGTNAVEAALKLARKITGRQNVVSFTNGFHGMTLGALAVTGNAFHRGGAGVPLANAQRMPYDGYLGPQTDSLETFAKMLADGSSGLDRPAAVIVETVQGEGGVNVASAEWLRGLQRLCKANDILLIVDDIQVGCGRTGAFFSFEEAGIKPDMVALSKSLSGYGLPFAMLLLDPALDAWRPGEHNGTFRGFNPAFVTATAALEAFWRDEAFADDVARKGEMVRARLDALADEHADVVRDVRGRGLIQGVELVDAKMTDRWARAAFEAGLVVETAGAEGQVMKLLPSLSITDDELEEGLRILETTLATVAQEKAPVAEVPA